MNSLKIISLTASLVLATIFTFSCSGDDGGWEEKFSYCIKDGFCHEGPYTLEGCSSFGGMPSNNCPNGGGGGSSSSGGGQGGGSSSSGGGSPSSSSVGGNGDDGSVVHEGQTYRTVKIGTQTWLAKNLNYAVAGSKCYDNDPANCVKYGRLYDWSTAMGLPSSCNENSCSSQIQPKHKGICPSGWHIPSNDDWDKLLRYVDNENGGDGEVDELGYDSYTAGRYLKATSDWNWNDEEDKSGNGTDQYDFSALPGGRGHSDGSFVNVGDHGGWYSASESEYKNYEAYRRRMYYDSDDAGLSSIYKSELQSVRCVKDN